MPLFVDLAGATFVAFGLHRQVWSYISDRELGAIVKAMPSVAVAAVRGRLRSGRPAARPRRAAGGVAVIQWLVLVVLLCASRLALPHRQGAQPAAPPGVRGQSPNRATCRC